MIINQSAYAVLFVVLTVSLLLVGITGWRNLLRYAKDSLIPIGLLTAAYILWSFVLRASVI